MRITSPLLHNTHILAEDVSVAGVSLATRKMEHEEKFLYFYVALDMEAMN